MRTPMKQPEKSQAVMMQVMGMLLGDEPIGDGLKGCASDRLSEAQERVLAQAAANLDADLVQVVLPENGDPARPEIMLFVVHDVVYGIRECRLWMGPDETRARIITAAGDLFHFRASANELVEENGLPAADLSDGFRRAEQVLAERLRHNVPVQPGNAIFFKCVV